jgi:Tol biopolymer transport system component
MPSSNGRITDLRAEDFFDHEYMRMLTIVSLLFLASMIIASCTALVTGVPETVSKTATSPSTLAESPTQTKEPTIQAASPTPTIDDGIFAPLVISSRYNLETGAELENQMLFTMQLDGTIEKQLTELGLDYFDPRWSPDCRTIVFWIYVGYHEGKYDERIGMINLNRNILDEISTSFERNSNPSWSPDGRRIVFDANDGQSWQIYVYDLDTDEISQLTFEGENLDPDWSPIDDQIVFSSSRDEVDVWSIYVMNADGSEQQEIVPASWGSEPGNWDNPFMNGPRTPTWSPDGELILFRVDEEIHELGIFEDSVRKMFITEIGDFNPQRLISGDREIVNRSDPFFYYWSEYDPVWSPDGQQIIFVRAKELTKDDQLCTVNLVNGEWSCLEDGSAAGFRGMDWCHSDQETTTD